MLCSAQSRAPHLMKLCILSWSSTNPQKGLGGGGGGGGEFIGLEGRIITCHVTTDWEVSLYTTDAPT